MKINNSILVLGVLSISFLIVLNIIQSSTAQYPRNYYNNYNPYNDYNRYSYEQYNYDKSYGDNYDDDDNRCIYEQYKKSLGDNYDDDELGDNYDDDEYYDCDDYYYSKTYDFTVRLP